VQNVLEAEATGTEKNGHETASGSAEENGFDEVERAEPLAALEEASGAAAATRWSPENPPCAPCGHQGPSPWRPQIRGYPTGAAGEAECCRWVHEVERWRPCEIRKAASFVPQPSRPVHSRRESHEAAMPVREERSPSLGKRATASWSFSCFDTPSREETKPVGRANRSLLRLLVNIKGGLVNGQSRQPSGRWSTARALRRFRTSSSQGVS